MALPDLIAVEDLFRPPHRAGATISPDGTRIAYLAPWKDRLNVWVQGLDGDGEPRRVTADDNRSVLHLPVDRRPALACCTCRTATATRTGTSYRVDLDDPDAPAVDLTPFPGVRRMLRLPGGPPGQGDRAAQQPEARTVRPVRTRHRHR